METIRQEAAIIAHQTLLVSDLLSVCGAYIRETLTCSCDVIWTERENIDGSTYDAYAVVVDNNNNLVNNSKSFINN